MSFHIININSPQCSITCKNGQLICKTDEETKSLPVEDIACIIITSFSATINSNLLIEAAKNGVPLILCEAFKPISLMIPANRSSDTILTRALLNTSEKFRAKLWRKTIDAKCKNQLSLCEKLAPQHPKIKFLKDTAFSSISNKESVCSRIYWQIIASIINDPEFRRNSSGSGMNNLLNYGYAVLLSTVLQKLFALGLDPTFGISHLPRERSTPLAYDLMEPFRVCVDYRVIQWLNNNPDLKELEVTKEFRKWVTGFAIERVEYFSFKLELRGCIEGVLRTFRRSVIEQKTRLYRPWLINKEYLVELDDKSD